MPRVDIKLILWGTHDRKVGDGRDHGTHRVLGARRRTDFLLPVGHRVGAVMSFLGAGVGLIGISHRMTADPQWQHIASYALACGAAIVLLFLLIGALAVRDDAPLHAWAGLLQRLVLAVWFPCTIALAIRLLRVAKAAREPN